MTSAFSDMNVCFFCFSGERPGKGGERFAKGLDTTIYTKHTHKNMIIIPCLDFAAARKSTQGSRKGGVRLVLGYHNFEQPPYTVAMENHGTLDCFMEFSMVLFQKGQKSRSYVDVM